MKVKARNVIAKVIAFAMIVSTVSGVGLIPEKTASAADLSQYKNVEFGIKYQGQVEAKANENGNAWSIEYFNVKDSAFQNGDVFFVSCKVSGAGNFKQVAIQSGVNNWDWNSAPKRWVENGIADDTLVAGKVKASKDGDNISFKIQLDNVVDETKSSAAAKIDLKDLYIMKVSDGSQDSVTLPEDKQLDLGTKYTGTVAAKVNADGVYEAQYFNVNDSSYSAGDTYLISYILEGADGFNQVATQSNLNGWSWSDAKRVWAEEGLTGEQDVTGDFVTSTAGNGISFKVRLDSQVDPEEELGESIDITLTDLVVVKVANDDSIAIPNDMKLTKGRSYSGEMDAVKKDGSWNVQYFNVKDSAFATDDQVKISFKISGAKKFKQLVVQSSLNNWSWDDAPKIWRNDGIDDNTTFSAIIDATQDDDNISFKLWLDNPVDESFDEASAKVTLTGLTVKDIELVPSLQEVYESYFNVGAAVSASMVNDVEYQNRIKGVFGTITAENEMKPDALLNKAASQATCENGVDGMPVLNLEYSGMSKILDFAKENGLQVRGHALVYAAQTPDWFFNVGYSDDENAKRASATVMSARMESYIEQVMTFVKENYPGVVTSWDVVNEALDDNGDYVENGWFETIGESYVAEAFAYASEYAEDDSKLYYNDYNMENADKQQAIIDIKNELNAGVRIDGVGMQEHVTTEYPSINNIEIAIDGYAEEDLDVQITELDVQIDENQSLTAQEARYVELFTLFKEKSDSITNVTLWGINDGSSWKSAKRPLLFFDDLTPKAVFYSVLGVVAQ